MVTPETELKFALSEDGLAKLGKHPAFSAPAETSFLRSVYFDTSACVLRGAGFGLRVREADGGFVQTLKWQQAASPIERTEWEAEVVGGAGSLTIKRLHPGRMGSIYGGADAADLL